MSAAVPPPKAVLEVEEKAVGFEEFLASFHALGKWCTHGIDDTPEID